MILTQTQSIHQILFIIYFLSSASCPSLSPMEHSKDATKPTVAQKENYCIKWRREALAKRPTAEKLAEKYMPRIIKALHAEREKQSPRKTYVEISLNSDLIKDLPAEYLIDGRFPFIRWDANRERNLCHICDRWFQQHSEYRGLKVAAEINQILWFHFGTLKISWDHDPEEWLIDSI